MMIIIITMPLNRCTALLPSPTFGCPQCGFPLCGQVNIIIIGVKNMIIIMIIIIFMVMMTMPRTVWEV